MTDLIQRLHAQAEKRGVATTRPHPEITSDVPRHPLEIAMEGADKLAGKNTAHISWTWSDGWFCWNEPLWGQTWPPSRARRFNSYIECVVALAEAEQ